MSRTDSAVFLVDVQQKLMPLIDDADRVVARCRFALEAARLFGLPIVATEQYRKGLGGTVAELAEFASSAIEKLTFTGVTPESLTVLNARSIAKVLLIGIEAHVCVSQTAFDLQARGFKPFVAADAVSSRRALDRETALARFRVSGIAVTTVEAAAFEWAESSACAEFKDFSALIKRTDAAIGAQ